MALIVAWVAVTVGSSFAAVTVVLIHEWAEQAIERIDQDIADRLRSHE